MLKQALMAKEEGLQQEKALPRHQVGKKLRLMEY
jgi:hypothetical protein